MRRVHPARHACLQQGGQHTRQHSRGGWRGVWGWHQGGESRPRPGRGGSRGSCQGAARWAGPAPLSAMHACSRAELGRQPWLPRTSETPRSQVPAVPKTWPDPSKETLQPSPTQPPNPTQPPPRACTRLALVQQQRQPRGQQVGHQARHRAHDVRAQGVAHGGRARLKGDRGVNPQGLFHFREVEVTVHQVGCIVVLKPAQESRQGVDRGGLTGELTGGARGAASQSTQAGRRASAAHAGQRGMPDGARIHSLDPLGRETIDAVCLGSGSWTVSLPSWTASLPLGSPAHVQQGSYSSSSSDVLQQAAPQCMRLLPHACGARPSGEGCEAAWEGLGAPRAALPGRRLRPAAFALRGNRQPVSMGW